MIGLSEDINEAKLGDEAPKRRRLSDVVQSTYATYGDSVEKRLKTAPFAEQSTAARLSKGFSDNMRQVLYTPQGIEIMYGQAKMTFGEMLGDEKMIERGRSLIQSANNEIEQAELEAERKGFSFSPEDYKSFSYALGGGAANYGVMLAAAYATGGLSKAFKASQKVVGGVTEATGLTSNFLLEAVGKNQKALERYKQETGDVELKNYNTQEGKKALATSLIYGTGSTILEKYMGFSQQRKMFAKPTEMFTQTAKIAASEGTTEFSQSLLEIGIDLSTNTIHWNDMPEQLREAFLEGAVGAVLGGSAGIASSISQRSKTKNMIKDFVKGTVSEEKKEIIANEIYEEGNAQLSNVIAKELKYDTELRNKHGDIYYAMVGAVSKEMEGKPRFMAMTEDERAAYANTAAKHFADQVLAEANFRNVLIDDVLSASDITYDNGIRIARHINLFDALKNPEMIPAETKLKRVSLLQFIRSKGGIKDTGGDVKSMGAIKQYPGLINNKGMGLDDMALSAWEQGYFPEFSERPEINDLLEAIDEGLRGNNRYNTEEQRTFADELADLQEELDRVGIDWRNMTAAEIEKAVDELPELQRLEKEAAFYDDFIPDVETNLTGMTEEEREAYDERMGMQLYQESFDIADENARLDEIYPAYEGETITIDGKERTVYNSNGDRIAKSKKALENFYKWFGDSKVVDEQGRPLVVYHGTNTEFDTFLKEKQGKNDTGFFGRGFYFTPKEKEAKHYANNKIVMPVYLNIKNPLDLSALAYKEIHEIGVDKLKELGIYTKEAKDFIENPVDVMKNGKPAKSTTTLENYIAEGKLGKKLSDNAKRLGFDGVIVKDKEYVAFEPNQIKSTSNRGTYSESENIYYQRGKNAKGVTQITPDAYIIKLLEGADESTLPHELAHYWLTEMWNYVRSGRASENYMKRWQNISDYLGIKPEQTRLTRGQQEKFASSYEAYLTRGDLPTPLIGSAFDDYDKWLQRVYNDYNKINYQSGMGKRRVRLTDAAIKFFQSMTTGTLEAPALAPKDTGVTIPEVVRAEEVIEPTNEIVDNPTTYDTTRVINITEGEKGVSKVFQREALKHADRIVDELGVSYNKINLEEQAVKAAEWVQNNLEEAREVVNGKAAPEGIIDTAIFIAYENEMLRIGNNEEYQRALKIHSQVQTQRGQAIAAERISTDDVYNPAYWWKKLQKNQENQVAKELFKGDVKALNEMIATETKSIMKEIAGKPKEEQVEALNKLAEKLQKEYKLDTLYQMPDDINERTVQEFIKDTIGVNPDVMVGNDVINKAEQLQKLWENTKDSSGNPSVEAMRAKRELNDLIQAQTPSNTLAIWTSIFGRGIMLTSVKSPVLNIISNIEAGFTEGITRRLMYGTTEKAVDKSVKQEFSKYAWEVYKASADIVTTMNDYDDDMRIIGEQILHSQGQGAFRAASRKVEEVSFKYLMGAPDAVAKTLAFNDTADLLATKIAKEEGAKDISARATEIYKDAILIKPQTEVGQKVREQSQAQAHYTTFTNDSWAARFGLSARNWLNMVGRNKIRLGDLAMKFVKTPANVQMMGLEYGFGSLYTLYNIQEIIKNPQSETSQIAIKAAVRNGLGIALAALLYSMLDPDDYFSEFDTLNPKEKDRMRALGAMPNSIKIGGKWVSLDYFGQLGIPLVGMLEARKNNSFRSYLQSGFTQAAKIPGIKETKQLIDSMSEYARYDLKPEKIAQMMAGTVLDQARAMTIPAIVNDIAKMTDDYERDTMGGVMDKVIASIPGLRQTLPERYGIQGLVKTEPALSTLLFGSRVKTAQEGKLVREIDKLAGKDEQPSISDVTKYGDLRLLSPEKKVKVRKEFYKAYNTESKKLISTREYQKKSPDDKKKALNKVRSRVVKSLKEKYSNDIQREKRRR